MTMIVSYTWKDKIIMMADSRSSLTDKDGKMIDYHDNSIKITPVARRFVIGKSGIDKFKLPNGNFLKTQQITEQFLKENINSIPVSSGKKVFETLIESWNVSLLQTFNIDPHSSDYKFSLIMNEWENINGLYFPRVHVYQSHTVKIDCVEKAIIGDEGISAIMLPYFQTDLNDMELEETIQFFKDGYKNVFEQIETVGGFIHVFILDVNPFKSRWYSHKVFN